MALYILPFVLKCKGKTCSCLVGKGMESLSFEEAFTRLEATVAALQNGQMPLERALDYYDEGMKLAQHCKELLQKAELRVQQLARDDADVPVVQSFELE
jgi:exodeoxyribonuclease VII small subunit